ncbi:protein of unknown function [Stenotrophomonas maltophilia]|nr:protein of unknown function [Stenotrophomonas maltophilia]
MAWACAAEFCVQGLRPCTRRINVNFYGNIKSWHSVGWRGGSGCGGRRKPIPEVTPGSWTPDPTPRDT